MDAFADSNGQAINALDENAAARNIGGSVMDWKTISEKLQEPLNPKAIKPPPQGKYGEYVDGLHVIREANRIFGENGWSYEITRLEMVSRLTTAKPQVRVGYMATVKVNVDGVIREGAALGTGMATPDNEADAHESAVKEAETDAMKRALRTFGNTFGLALYDKDKSAREVGVATPKSDPSAIEAAIGSLVNADNLDQLRAIWVDLPKPIQAQGKVIDAKDSRKAALEAPQEEAT